MTYKGGWTIDHRRGERPPEPAPADLPAPARWRCCRRREGRIDRDGTEWVVEHPDAAEHYERERRLERIERIVREEAEAAAEDRDGGDAEDDGHLRVAEEALLRYVDGDVPEHRARAVTDMAAKIENPELALEDEDRAAGGALLPRGVGRPERAVDVEEVRARLDDRETDVGPAVRRGDG